MLGGKERRCSFKPSFLCRDVEQMQEGCEAMWIESKTKEVLSSLVSLKKCLVGWWDIPSSCLSVLGSLKPWV